MARRDLEQKRKKHRDGDKPAIVTAYYHIKTQTWYYHGEIHRDDEKPAFIGGENNRNKTWWKNGKPYKYSVGGDKPEWPNFSFSKPVKSGVCLPVACSFTR